MRTCYISDLDGTLLDKSVELSEKTKRELVRLLDKGISFTVATARSPYSVKSIFSGINISLPMILMNGVVLYDLSADEIISYAQITKKACDEIISLIHSFGLTAFAYKIKDKILYSCYEDISEPQMYEFYKERLEQYGKRFDKVSSLEDIDETGMIYFSLLYPESVLAPLCEKLSEIKGISFTFYNDIYSDMWYLEIFSEEGTKYNGAMYIKERFSFDKLVAFGDSENDISLFNACDVKCAVSNASDCLKTIADEIIDNSENDAVVSYISKELDEMH